MTHLSPPFRVFSGQLKGVTVVAPQAPYNMKVDKVTKEPIKEEVGWDWGNHVQALADYLRHRYQGRRVLATGFSRGGLGVLQLLRADSGLITKWAIIDPQPARNEEEESILPGKSEKETHGWLRYGPQFPEIMDFGNRLAQRVVDAKYIDLHHGELALHAYGGTLPSDRPSVHDTPSLYDFLELPFVSRR
jgi:pimeloyl-ACP methyl ester carboxylesterase